MKKYLSIITQFGCHYTCPCCIVKNNNIDIKPTTIESLDLVEKQLKNYDILSVSGGGDPLFNFNKNIEYYNKLFYICMKNNKPLEMHTSYCDIVGFSFARSFPLHRMVYHLRAKDIEDKISSLKKMNNEIVRIVFVVVEEMTVTDVERIVKLVEQNKDISELSFRQMVGKDFETKYYLHDYLKNGHLDKWYYIEQNDYNDYFEEGVIKKGFENFKKEKVENYEIQN